MDVVEPLGDEVVVHGSTPGTTVESGAEEELEIPLAVEGGARAGGGRFAPEHEPAPGDIAAPRRRAGARSTCSTCSRGARIEAAS